MSFHLVLKAGLQASHSALCHLIALCFRGDSSVHSLPVHLELLLLCIPFTLLTISFSSSYKKVTYFLRALSWQKLLQVLKLYLPVKQKSVLLS